MLASHCRKAKCVPLVVDLVPKPGVSVGQGVELPDEAVACRVVRIPRLDVAHDAVHLTPLPSADALRQVPAVGRVRATVPGELGRVPRFPARFLDVPGVRFVSVCHDSTFRFVGGLCDTHCRIVPRPGIEPGFITIDAGMLRLGFPNHCFDSGQVILPSRA